MGEDFKAFEQFSKIDWSKPRPITFIPSNVPDAPNKNYLFLDLSSLGKKLSLTEIQGLFFEEFEKSLGGPSGPIEPTEITAEQRKTIDNMKAALHSQVMTNRQTHDALSLIPFVLPMRILDNKKEFTRLSDGIDNDWTLAQAGGAFSNNKYGVVLFSEKRLMYDDILNGSLSRIYGHSVNDTGVTEHEKKILNGYVRYHEAAHNMLSLKEAGADFMAAAMVLRKNPGAADALQLSADLRNIMWTGQDDASVRQHGAECYDAITHALNIDPEELKKMSIKELHGIAKTFDDQTQRNALNPNSAEKIITGTAGLPTNSLIDVIYKTTIRDTFTLSSLNANSYPQGSPEDKLAESMLASAERLKERTLEPAFYDEPPTRARPGFFPPPVF